MNKMNKIKASIAATALFAVGGVATFSLLSDTSTTDIEVTSATFEMAVNDSTDGTYEVDLEATNLYPGETRSGDIELKNNSSIPATITLSKNELVSFEVDVDDGVTPFTSTTLEPGASKELALSVGLDYTETGSPADETLTVTFTAEQ